MQLKFAFAIDGACFNSPRNSTKMKDSCFNSTPRCLWMMEQPKIKQGFVKKLQKNGEKKLRAKCDLDLDLVQNEC